ncbi:hypothetical protein HY407_01615 [Candidatus Gottesmanbacteria bacterium]|nr:hypothetical protein [Candidatus Gottesmanbacteria bacterium]
MKKIILLSLVGFFLLGTLISQFSVAKKAFAQNREDCIRAFNEGNNLCRTKNNTYIDACPGAQGVDLTAHAECLKKCRADNSACFSGIQDAYDACIKERTVKLEQDKLSDQDLKPDNKPKDVDKSPTQTVNDWIKDTFGELDIEQVGTGSLTERPPLITPEEEVIEQTPQDSYFLGVINSDGNNHGLIKYPGSDEFINIMTGDIPPGSTILSRDDQIIIFTKEKGKIVIEPNSEFILSEAEPLDLSKGTVEIKMEESPEQATQQHDVQTEFFDIIIISTHFWVTHEPGKQSIAGVYDGTLEIKTKDGKAITLSPNGTQPAVVVISQKVKISKLLITTLLVLGIIAGLVWFLKKGRHTQKRR